MFRIPRFPPKRLSVLPGISTAPNGRPPIKRWNPFGRIKRAEFRASNLQRMISPGRTEGGCPTADPSKPSLDPVVGEATGETVGQVSSTRHSSLVKLVLACARAIGKQSSLKIGRCVARDVAEDTLYDGLKMYCGLLCVRGTVLRACPWQFDSAGHLQDTRRTPIRGTVLRACL